MYITILFFSFSFLLSFKTNLCCVGLSLQYLVGVCEQGHKTLLRWRGRGRTYNCIISIVHLTPRGGVYTK